MKMSRLMATIAALGLLGTSGMSMAGETTGLTDTAIKELGKELGYVERRLFERGEDYVEALENKFFEYFGIFIF